MVTFICEYCDVTLKKKQCDGHVLGRCRPGSLICIDCSQTFRGNEFKTHISCISQVDKHWGQYAPSKKGNKNNQKAVQSENQNNTAKQEDKQHNSKNTPNGEEAEANQTKWKGWKNQIKLAFVEQQSGKVQLEDLKEKVLKRYHEQFEENDEDEETFMKKLKNLKKVKLTTYVTMI